MLDKATINQLHELRLHTMAAILSDQEMDPKMQELPFDERLGMLVEAEWMKRRERKINRLVQQAQFRFPAVLEDIDYEGKQGISKADILRLNECTYLRRKQNIIISGLTGIGKTYIACALGRSACIQNFTVRYMRIPDFFIEVSDAQIDNRYSSFMKKFSSIALLVLDDFGFKSFTSEESQEILELMEHRYNVSSTIFVSQLPSSNWHNLFPDPTVADAILDRIVHNSYKFNLIGESMRKVLSERQMKYDL